MGTLTSYPVSAKGHPDQLAAPLLADLLNHGCRSFMVWYVLCLINALQNVDLTAVGSVWFPCSGTITPWDSHLGR